MYCNVNYNYSLSEYNHKEGLNYSYVQESGRGGRDGSPATATLYYCKQDLYPSSHINDSMRKYCENSEQCRRQVLMDQFTDDQVKKPAEYHQCCDLCSLICTCEVCNPQLQVEDYQHMCIEVEAELLPPQLEVATVITDQCSSELTQKLEAYKLQLIQEAQHATSSRN